MPIPNGQPDNAGSSNEQDFEFTEEELANLDDKAKQAITSLSAQKKHWREKAKVTEDELKKIKEAPPAPATDPNPAPASTPPQMDPEAAARKVLLEEKLTESLVSVPEDKRAQVEEVYRSLTTGKSINSASFQSYFDMAKSALGVTTRSASSHRITTGAGGAIPPKTHPGPTPEQIKMAQAAGNDPAKVYGPTADLSGLHNAERFIDKNEEEIN